MLGAEQCSAVVFSLQYKEFFSPVSLQWQSAFILTPKVRKTSWWIDPFHSHFFCWVKNWLIMQIHRTYRDAQLLQSYLCLLFILTRNFPWDLLHLRLSFLFDTKSAFFASNQEKKNKLLPQYSRDLKVCKNQVEII